ncbi:MAG: two-component system cell cycle sensor histidine kinase/response regulator CckA [Candidatus Latescibacterota bacterium]|jgi:two-component system cell cycle sensor histidine kinase/response regulator CckA
MDIQNKTQSQRTEEINAERYRLLVENAPICIHEIDLQGCITSMNNAGLKMMGAENESKVCGLAYLDVVAKEDRDRIKILLDRAYEGYPSEFRFQSEGENGLFLFDSSFIPIKDSDGNVIKLMGVTQDVTEQMQTEKELREGNERFHQLTNNISEVFWMTEPVKNEMLYISPGYEKVWGRTCESLYTTPRNWIDAIHIDDRQRILNAALTKQVTGEYDEEYRIVRPDGTIRWIYDRAYPVQDEQGNVYRIAGIAEDITERKRLEEELRRIQNMDALGILAGGIAHDFNNVLTGVIGNLAILETSLDKESESYEFVVDAKNAANKTRSLTQQLMTFSKGGVPVKENASLIELIEETAKLCLSGSNTKPEYHLPSDLFTTKIDKGQIGQVIQNLVINADQAMPEGGTLIIAANNLEIGDNDVVGLSAGKYVKVSVGDQGIGIPENLLGKIFNPYFTTKDAGHGLGLAISYSIVNKHDGYITARSEPGIGSTFEFYLPALKKEIIKNEKKTKASTQATGRILLMDDDEIVRRPFKKMLEMLGYEVDNVQHGEEALIVYQTSLDAGKPYNAVIMDLTIPGGMGGKEAIQKLRILHPEARAIVSSGYSHDPVMAHYKEHGFDAVIQKPIIMEDLTDVLQSVLFDT